MPFQISPCTLDDLAALFAELDQDLQARYPSLDISTVQLCDFDPAADIALIAKEATDELGCVVLKKYAAQIGELKRLYIAPTARRRGIAQQLLLMIENLARAQDYQQIILETGDQQAEAVALYLSLGYSQTPAYPPYCDNPVSICFAKHLI
ncbi:GNAT family N-acetyltransferase [Chitinibacter bivalviorum]|uniref:GNAT family N-acetyltransferase n=1 Tax=Chitinibacter bivalviorum TaxID=2739434 RepID=A0A7H9BGY3_9NEIS|nr:GNAT family N-acetyltransferase [Chitinibacter bivalviorum]QLG87809.1 GNAT family N-acetyltransferase [Chitinibacter bivalviorum]